MSLATSAPEVKPSLSPEEYHDLFGEFPPPAEPSGIAAAPAPIPKAAAPKKKAKKLTQPPGTEVMTVAMVRRCDAAVAIAQTSPKGRDLGYLARYLVECTLPHSRPDRKQISFVRRNGDTTVSVQCQVDKNDIPLAGLPYGSLPRLFLIWLCTEVTRQKSQVIEIGGSLPKFFEEMGMVPMWGIRGNVHAMFEQIERLRRCTIYVDSPNTDDNGKKDGGKHTRSIQIIEEALIYWTDKKDNSKVSSAEKQSWVKVSDQLYKSLTSGAAVPVDRRAVIALKQFPLAIDLLIWASYRVYHLDQPLRMTWAATMMQFGAGYKEEKVFKYHFKRAIKAIAVVAKPLKLEADKHFVLRPSKTLVPRIN